MEDNRVLAFLKFGKQQHIVGFLSGSLYMNPLSYFADVENNDARRDPREGQSFWIQSRNIRLSVEINGRYQEIPGLCGPMASSHPDDLKANVFCMHAIRASRIQQQPIDQANLRQFGDWFALVLFGDEFLKRVKAAARVSALRLSWALVKYVDEGTYQGPIGVFRKSAQFQYQSEFRIVVQPGTGQLATLQIGDLRDIAISGPTDELNQILRIESREGHARLLCATSRFSTLSTRTF